MARTAYGYKIYKIIGFFPVAVIFSEWCYMVNAKFFQNNTFGYPADLAREFIALSRLVFLASPVWAIIIYSSTFPVTIHIAGECFSVYSIAGFRAKSTISDCAYFAVEFIKIASTRFADQFNPIYLSALHRAINAAPFLCGAWGSVKCFIADFTDKLYSCPPWIYRAGYRFLELIQAGFGAVFASSAINGRLIYFERYAALLADRYWHNKNLRLRLFDIYCRWGNSLSRRAFNTGHEAVSIPSLIIA